MAGNDHTNNFKDMTGFLNIWFFNDFLSKDSVWSSRSGNPIDCFHPLGVALKNSSKVKNLSGSMRNDTKAGKTRIWNVLLSKLIH